MRIIEKYKVREVAGENIVMLQGKNPGDMTTVIALNKTSLFLWDNLKGRDFELDDVAKLLTDTYDVDDATAKKDAKQWIETLKNNNIIA